MFYVYIWKDPKDATPRYVGKGKNQRVWHPFKGNKRIANMVQKRHRDGYVCLPQVIWVENESNAHELEMLLISEIGREDLKTGPLFNLTDGGEGLSNPSKETCKKMRDAKLGKISISRGLKRGPNENISKAKLGKTQTYVPVSCIICKRELTTNGLARHFDSEFSHGSRLFINAKYEKMGKPIKS